MSKTNIYKAEALLKERKRKGKTEYLVKWCGWSSKHNSWEPRENIIDERLIEEFEARNARKSLRRGGYRKAVKRVRQSVAHDESNDDDFSIDPSPSRRRGRPRKQRRLSDDTGEAEEKDDKMSEGGKKKAGSSSFEKEEEENDEECEEEAPAADEDKGEVVEEGNLVIEGEKVEGKQEEKVGDVSAKKERSDISTAVAVDNSGSIKSKKPEKEVDRMHDVSRGDSEHQASADKSSSVADEEAGPSVARARPSAEDKEMGVNVKNADETTLRPEQPGYIQSSNNNVPIPRTFHGHMIPMRIEPSERQEEVRTHAFVISEPGSSATTEELQVFSEVEQIQAIKNELMNESGWSKHDSIRHDSFQYNGTHVLTEIVGKDGEPVRFISL